MDIQHVDPQLRRAVRRLPRMPFASPWGRALIRTALRLLPAPKLTGVRVERIEVPGVSIRLHYPDVRRSDAALLWIHGGGYVIGTPKLGDPLCAQTARELGIVVAAVGYRLAPEHRFPAALDDCHAGWRWLLREAKRLGIDPARIAIGGQSAGGGLAASLVQRIHDEAGPDAAAQWLFCPMIDDRTAARRELDATDNLIWNNRDNASAWRAYLGQEPGSGAIAPYAAASRRDDLAGLPPAWIGVGDIDLFCAEDRAYADRLADAGVEVRFDLVPGAPHGFEAWAAGTAIARDFTDRAIGWLGRTLG